MKPPILFSTPEHWQQFKVWIVSSQLPNGEVWRDVTYWSPRAAVYYTAQYYKLTTGRAVVYDQHNNSFTFSALPAAPGDF